MLRHDVGNAASHVLGYVDLVSDEDVEPERRRELRRIICHAGLKITRLTGSARALAQSMQEDGLTELRVADDGPGVSDARKEAIFGREEKGLDSSGTGMGLYLAKHVAQECGGSTWVEDNDPTGAIFVVRLISAEMEAE